MRKLVQFLSAAALAFAFGSTEAHAACISGGAVDNFDDCIAGAKGTGDCLLAWSVDNDGAGNPPLDTNGNPTSKISCTDGAACDRDGHVNGRCTFEVGACVNAGGSCTAASLTSFSVDKPSDKDVAKKSFKQPNAVYLRRTLATEVDAILGATEACTPDDLEVVVPLATKGGVCNVPSGEKCTNDQDCDDYCIPAYKKGKVTLKAEVSDGVEGDGDTLSFTCLPTTPGPGQCTEVFEIANAADLIGGPLAQGRTGDWMLRNSDIRVLVRDVGRAHSFMRTFGGHILDADLVRDDPAEDRDNWMGMQAMVNIGSSQNTQNITVLNDGGDCAPGILRTTGVDDLFDVLSPDIAIFSAGNTLSVPPGTEGTDLPLNLTTDYIIRPDKPYVQVVTTYENTSGTDLDLFVGDYVNGGGELEDFGPGVGFGQPLLRLGAAGQPSTPQGLDHLAFQGAGDGRGVAYGVVLPRSPSGDGQDGTYETGAFTQSGVSAWVHRMNLVTVLNASYTNKPPGPLLVPANGTATLRRWFVVGETVADVTKAREELFGNKVGIIQGVITSAGQPVEGAHIAFLRRPGNRCGNTTENCINVFSATLTDEYGFYRAYLPQAGYEVSVRGPNIPYENSDDEPSGQHDVSVKGKKTLTVDVDLPATGGLQVDIVDHNGAPIAGKVSVVGIDPSSDPGNLDSIAGFIDSEGRYFGYDPREKAHDSFGLVKAVFADHSGDTGVFNLEPGSYHLVVSHGPEYDVFAQPITITAGATTEIDAVVNQVVDTAGFVSIDTHVHSIPSPDSAVPLTDRITSMLGEGVDFFVPSDHDHVHDIADDVAAMGATGLVGTAPSSEVTTFSYGHFNIWPLTVNPATINGGALDWGRDGTTPGEGYIENLSYDLLPSEIFGSFNPANQVIQINHFNSGTLGHFNNLGIDTVVSPPESSDLVYRCDAGPRATLPCTAQVCLGGTNELGACVNNADCTGGGACNIPSTGRNCPAGACVDVANNLGEFIRLDPAVANLYDDGFTALEIWIEQSRGQTDLALNENLADWAGLLNQGSFKTGIADSDTHERVLVQSGGPRTYVASATDDPGLINPTTLAQTVNAGRAIGSGGLFMRVELEGDLGATASHELGDPMTVEAAGGGADSVNIHIEAPTWAEFDRVEIYANSQPSCKSAFTFLGVINPVCDVSPLVTLNKGTHFTVNTTTGVSGFGSRLVADISQPLTISADTWVIAVARGTDGVSQPLFPMAPTDLSVRECVGGFNPGAACETSAQCVFGVCTSINATLANLTDNGTPPPWNLNEKGQLAMAFSNPLFFDFEGDGFCHGAAVCP